MPTLVSRVQRIYSDQSWATRGQIRPLVSNGVFTKPLMRWTNGIGYINGQSDQSYRRRPHRQIHRASNTVGLHPGRLAEHRTIKGDNPSLPLPLKRKIGKTFLRNHQLSERSNPTSKRPASAGGVRRSSGLRTSNSPNGQTQSVTSAPASRIIWRETSDPEVRMELSSVKTNGIKYEQGAGRNISRHSGELQRSIGKPDRWSSDSRQPDGDQESSLRLAKQYQKLVKGNKGNPGHNASGYTTSVQRSYQSDPTNLESTHPNSNVGSGNPGLFDLRSPNNIQRSPAIVRRQISSVFQTVPGMANYDDLGAWLEKQLQPLFSRKNPPRSLPNFFRQP